MNKITRKIQFALLGLATACGIALIYAAPSPTDYPELNDIPGDEHMMTAPNVIDFVTNFVGKSVTLSNGWLIVDGQAVNIAEPTKEVLVTNIIGGVTNITTNTYPVVYQNSLTNYATIVRLTITTNGETIVTNVSPVAYLDDIPPDNAKADKIITVCDYYFQFGGSVLQRILRADAPFSAWSYSTTNGTPYSVSLIYTNGIWDCHYHTDSTDLALTQSGIPNQDTIIFHNDSSIGDFTFTRTNVVEHSFVVYTDMLSAATNGVFDGLDSTFVSRTNLTNLAKVITEDQLLTVNGIASILADMRSELISIGGGSAMKFTVSGIANGSTVTLGNIVPKAQGDFIDVDWGDGTRQRFVAPTNNVSHTYVNPQTDTFEIKVEGFIESIGGLGGETPTAFINGGSLTDVVIGLGVGLQELGDYCFYGCTDLESLKFIPDNIPKFGASCFEGCSGITSLAGMPSAVTEIPARCFANSGISTLFGMPSGISFIGDSAFSNTTVSSCLGIPDSVKELSPFTFSMCPNFSLDTLNDTSITNIGAYCFSGTGISSADFSMSDVCVIGEYAFMSSYGNPGTVHLPGTCTSIGANAFSTLLQPPVTLRFDNIDTDTVRGLSNFPWGLSVADNESVIECLDGYITGENGAWITHLWTTAMSLSLPSGTTSFTLGSMVSDAPISIDWGDGSQFDTTRSIEFSRATSTISHTYYFEEPTKITVKLYGKIKSISATPNEYPFLKVKKEVYQDANNGNPYLTNFAIGDAVGITNVGSHAFAECKNLSGVGQMPRSVVALGDSCFTGCTSIVSIEGISDTSVDTLPDGCFSGCTNISSLSGLSGMSKLRKFGDGCFRNSLSLKTLDGIPVTLDTLGDGCFQKTMTIVGGLTNINAIYSTGITSIPSKCFSGCSSIEGEVDISKITSIGDEGFANCTGISQLDISTIDTFGDRCFSGLGQGHQISIKDDGFIEYKAVLRSSTMSFGELADKLGLESSNRTDVPENEATGVKIIAKNGYELAWNNTARRWEPLITALQVSLSGVTNGTKLAAVLGGTLPVSQDVSFLWNWGDGQLAKNGSSKWLSDSPSSIHTYSSSSSTNFTITVKGMVGEISAMPNNYPWVKISDSRVGNPFVTGYHLPEKSPIRLIGDFAFAGCTNMPAVNVLQEPRENKVKTSSLRALDNHQSRLEKLDEESIGHELILGDHAFYGSGIAALSTMHTNVSSLSEACFMNCKNLETMAGMPPNIRQLSGACFSGSGMMTLEGFPTGLRWISTNCFSSCYNLSSLVPMPPSVEYIGDYAFFDCTNITTLMAMGDNVTDMGIGVFGQTGIQSIEGFSLGMKEIPAETFRNCYSLKTTYGITEDHSITNIGDRAFLMCTGLEDSQFIPDSVERIGADAFAGCISMTNGMLGRSISEIGPYALDIVGMATQIRTNEFGTLVNTEIMATNSTCSYVEGLLNKNPNTNDFVTIRCLDGDVSFIDGRWRSKFKTVEIELANVPSGTVFSFIGRIESSYTNMPIYIDWGAGIPQRYSPLSTMTYTYRTKGDYVVRVIGFIDEISCISNNYPVICEGYPLGNHESGNPYIHYVKVNGYSNLRSLGEFCFKGCYNLRYFVADGYGVPSIIGEECFSGCSSLSSLDGLPNGLNTLGVGCFKRCNSLSSLSGLPNTVAELPTNCFAGCKGLLALDIRPTSGIYAIRSGCFMDCTSLLSLETYPTSQYMTIENAVFKNCTSLQSLSNFPYYIPEIPAECFMGCSSLKNLNGLPEETTVIGDYAFNGCGLTSLDGTASPLSSIGAYAFSSNNSLAAWGTFTDINNSGAGLTLLDGAFRGCSSFGGDAISFVLPSNTTYVGEQAFEGCPITPLSCLPDSIRVIHRRTFCDTSITNITILTSNVTNIEEDAFAYGNGESWSLDGFETSRVINFPELSVTTITNLNQFPWGAIHTTRFVGNDGFVVYHDGEWIEVRVSLESKVVINAANSEVVIGGFVPEDRHGVCIDWGDGNYVQWVKEGEVITNKFINALGILKPYTITIRRPFIELNGISSSGNPFIVVSQPNYNYVTSVNVTDASRLKTVGENCFRNLLKITEVPGLPETVKEIQSFAFYGDSSIGAIVSLPTSLESLGTNVFANMLCVTSSYFNLPNLSAIPAGTFMFQTNLTEITFTEQSSCKNIGTRAFAIERRLRKLDLSMLTGITNISTEAFYSCPYLEEIFLPASIEDCERFAFTNIAQSCEMKEDEDGYWYKGLIDVSGILAQTLIDKGREDTMWGTPTNIKFRAMNGDIVYSQEKKKWIINYGPMRIDLAASNGAEFILNGFDLEEGKQVTIDWGDGSSNILNTGYATHVYENSSMYNIRIRGTVKGIYGSSDGTIRKPFLYSENNLGAGVIGIYVSHGIGVEDIGENAFYGYTNLTSLSGIESDITNVGNFAFAECTGLTNAVLPSTLKSIGEYVFANCQKLKEITILPSFWPLVYSTTFSSLTDAEIKAPNAFAEGLTYNTHSPWGVSGDSSFSFWDGEIVKENDEYVFSSWTISFRFRETPYGGRFSISAPALHSYNDPLTIEKRDGDGTIQLLWDGNVHHSDYQKTRGISSVVGFSKISSTNDVCMLRGHFDSWDGIISYYKGMVSQVKIGKSCGLKSLGASSFENIPAIELVIPNTVTDIGKRAFAGSGFSSLSFWPSSATHIPEECFNGCPNLRSMTGLPNTIVSIGDRAFLNVGNGNTFSFSGFPSTVNRIGKDTFKDTHIISLNGMSQNITDIPEGCFENCGLPTLVGMNDSVTNIGNRAFSRNNLTNLVGMSFNVISIGGLTKGRPSDNRIHVEMVGSFSENDRLNTLHGLSPSLKNLDTYAFIGTNFGYVIELPETVEKIAPYSFGYAKDGWRIPRDPHILLYLKSEGLGRYYWPFDVPQNQIGGTTIGAIFSDLNRAFRIYTLGNTTNTINVSLGDSQVVISTNWYNRVRTWGNSISAYDPYFGYKYHHYILHRVLDTPAGYMNNNCYVTYQNKNWPIVMEVPDEETKECFLVVANPDTIAFPFSNVSEIKPLLYAVHEFDENGISLSIAPIEKHDVIGKGIHEATPINIGPWGPGYIPKAEGFDSDAIISPIPALVYDWGDGSQLELATEAKMMSHNYSSSGTYTQKIYGLIKTVNPTYLNDETNGTFTIEGKEYNPYLKKIGYTAMSGIWEFKDGWTNNCQNLDSKIEYDLNLNSYYPMAGLFGVEGISQYVVVTNYAVPKGHAAITERILEKQLFFFSEREPESSRHLWPFADDINPQPEPDINITVKKPDKPKKVHINLPSEMKDTTGYIGYAGGKNAWVFADDILPGLPHAPVKVDLKASAVQLAFRAKGVGAYAKYGSVNILTPIGAVKIRDNSDQDKIIDNVVGVEFTDNQNSLLKNIPSDMFSNCPNLSGKVSLPPSVTNIGDNAFANTKIDDFGSIPASCKSIGQGAFNSNKPISVTFTNSITSLNIAQGNSAIGSIPYVLFDRTDGAIKVYKSPVNVTFANNRKVEILLNLNRLYDISSLNEQFQRWHLSITEEIIVEGIYRCRDGMVNIHSKDGQIYWE